MLIQMVAEQADMIIHHLQFLEWYTYRDSKNEGVMCFIFIFMVLDKHWFLDVSR